MTRQVVAIIQARLGSSRFPRKSLAMFKHRPMIEHVIQRVQQVPLIDEVVVTIPTLDKALIDVVRDYGSRLVNTDVGNRPVRIACGPEQDVLLRYWLAACEYQADVVVRVTGDCPLWSSKAGNTVVKAFLEDKKRRAFWSNDTTLSGWPDGTDVEVFSMDLLRQARNARSTLTNDDREHVTTWMRRQLHGKCGVVYRKEDNISSLKLSVDTIMDLLRIETFDEALLHG